MMKTMNLWMCSAAFVTLAGCLGPNPYLDSCGQEWAVESVDAKGGNAAGIEVPIKENDEWTRGTLCLTSAQAETVTDPGSLVNEALRLQALSNCKAQAVDLSLISEDCDENLSEPVYVGECLVEHGECQADDEAGGTEGSDTVGGGFDTPTDKVSCVGDVCSVDQSLVAEVLGASESTFAADGTTVAPHYTSSGAQDGWVIAGIGSGNLGDALGFENGDVVIEVDGETVDSWLAVIDAANRSLHADEVRVVFVRDGRQTSRTFSRI